MARDYLFTIQRFYFVITLVMKEHVLESLLRSLTTFLQAKRCDFVEKQRKQQQQQLRADPEICIPYMKALSNWQRNLRFNRASRAGKQRLSDKFPGDTPCQYLLEDGDVPTTYHSLGTSSMDHLLHGMNTQLLVSRLLRGSVCTSYGNNWCT